MQIGSKLKSIYEALLKYKNVSTITFGELKDNCKIEVEDLEDVLFEAKELNIFELIVDYGREIVKVKYIRRDTFGKEDLADIKNRISGLRTKLNGFVKKIDVLITSNN